MNPDADPNGQFFYDTVRDLMIHVRGSTDERPKYSTHFTTCPKADEHRRPR